MIRHRVFLAYIRTIVTMQNVKLTPGRKSPGIIPGILICAADLWHTTLWVQFCLVRNFEASKNTTKILYPQNLSLSLKGKCKCVYGCWHVYTCACVLLFQWYQHRLPVYLTNHLFFTWLGIFLRPTSPCVSCDIMYVS